MIEENQNLFVEFRFDEVNMQLMNEEQFLFIFLID